MKQRKLTDSAAEDLKKMLIVTLLGRAVSVTFQSLDKLRYFAGRDCLICFLIATINKLLLLFFCCRVLFRHRVQPCLRCFDVIGGF